ncbi:MAG: hypothetical protein Kow00127_01610 [Bacteroidales bacterium]
MNHPLSDTGTEQKKLPLVTIGVPVYNGEAYLETCLKSIEEQTYQNWKCLIIDNCSTDATNRIAATFAGRDNRFILKRFDELLPVMENWNRVLPMADRETKYFKIIPADDFIFPEYLSRCVELMEKYSEVGIVSTYRIDGRKVRGNGPDILKGPVIEGSEVVRDELLLKMDVTGSANTVLYRMSELEKLDGFPHVFSLESLHGDTDLAYQVLSRAKLGFVFQVLSYTRRHETSITTKVASQLNTSICFRDNQLRKYREFIPDFERYYRRHRNSYALLYFKFFTHRNHKALKWHRENLDNPIRWSEIFRSLVYTYIVDKIRGRNKD